LAVSIAEHGVLQPILVSESGPGRFHLIAGERRWRAAALAGLETVPVLIREKINAQEELALALVENLQRRDLSPLEEARAFEQLQSRFGLSQARIAETVGMDRSTVANSLRLLRLDDETQAEIESGRLSGSHARALLSFEDLDLRRKWARRTVAEGLSVRQLEEAARAARSAPDVAPKPAFEQDPNLLEAAEALALALGSKVAIRAAQRGGSITIRCSSRDELMRVYDQLLSCKGS
jgi:ParB family chromosome partitioning protein